MTDWAQVQRVLDDGATAHACAFCGVIPVGDAARWGLAVRRPGGHTSVLWADAPCVVARLARAARRLYDPPAGSPPPA